MMPYLGGERNGGKAGRGSENKVPFVIALQTSDEGHLLYVVIEPLPGFTKTALADWAQRHLHPGTDVHSDGLGAFRALEEQGHAHTVIQSDGGRAATEAGQMGWLNTILGNVKRSLDGTYHAFDFLKYAHRYLAEAAWRFNRRFDLAALVPRLLVAAAARTLQTMARCAFALRTGRRNGLNFGTNQEYFWRYCISTTWQHQTPVWNWRSRFSL